MMLFSCTDTLVEEQVQHGTSGDGKGLGELVMFSVGTTENVETRASYYMPDSYRFVCRMYYKAQTGSEDFDVTGGTDQTAWLKVSGNVGNSLYWNKEYRDVDSSIKGIGGVDEYGNDYSATAFYWQNRKEHAFLAWTDLNKAREMKGGDAEGRLNFVADTQYRVSTGEKVREWEIEYYEIYGIGEKFANREDMETYVKAHGKDDSFTASQDALQTEKGYDWSDAAYYYRHGKQYKYSFSNAARTNETTTPEESYDYQWYQEFMYFHTMAYAPDNTEEKEMFTAQSKQDRINFLLKDGVRVAKAELKVNEEDEPVDDEGNELTDPAEYIYTYLQTDELGNLIYDETQPEFTFYYSTHYVRKEKDEYQEFNCNAFDLTRGSKTSMSEQPDIAQALEIQAPTGATQESNRVNLYFKHQFSQIQVNLKNSADNSVVLLRDDIKKVELLGVTEKGYVFTDLDERGKVRPAAYQEIDFSKYTEAQLKNNQFGTSFSMFELSEEQTETGYLKSYNAIAFGQLQAIRITWEEREEGAAQSNPDYKHVSTYRIPTDLMNLQSGVRYVWNIEIRRGTIAIIRTEIIDWELPKDLPHNGTTEGTIQDND